jgi:hypothetical protein
VNVGRLIPLIADKDEAVTAYSQYGWHNYPFISYFGTCHAPNVVLPLCRSTSTGLWPLPGGTGIITG